MPYNNNKWAIIIEPTFQYFKSETELFGRNIIVHYKSIELPIGIRYYVFLKNNSKIFINASLILDFSNHSTIDFDSRSNLTIKSNNNFGFGIGYKKNNKYSLEFRYQTGRDILKNYLYWRSDYNTLSLIFGYTIF